MNMTSLSDYDLVKLCKEGNRNAFGTLYTRYIPFINKKYTKFQTTLSSHYLMDREDFQNECYFELCEAVKYVNFSKITDPIKWKFIGCLMWYVDAYIWDKIKKSNDTPIKETSLLVEGAEEGEEVIITDLIPELCSEDLGLEHYYEQTVLQTFYSSLTEFEKEVLTRRASIREKGKPTQLTEIAKDLGTNFSKVQETCKILEGKFKSALVY